MKDEEGDLQAIGTGMREYLAEGLSRPGSSFSLAGIGSVTKSGRCRMHAVLSPACGAL